MAKDPIFDRGITLAISGAKDEVQKLFVAEIRRQLDRAIAEARPTSYEQYVDRVPGRVIEQVEPFGIAVFTFSYLSEIAKFALSVLREISPVDRGSPKREANGIVYRDNHNVYVDGVLIESLSSIGAADRVVIANTLPYARRLELPSKWRHGPLKGQPRGWSIQPQVPQPADSIYQHAAATVRRRYGNMATVESTWVGLAGGTELTGGAANESRNRFPAIVIEERWG